jgi:predicted RNA polymerase sigma factor
VQEGLVKYKQGSAVWKLWLIKAQLLENMGRMEDARAVYEEALQTEGVKGHRQIWLNYA